MSPTKPWALSPLISTMPHFAHKRLLPTCLGGISVPPFPTAEPVKESTEDLHLTVIDYHSNSPASWSSSSQSSNEPTPTSSSLSLASNSSTKSKSTSSIKIRSPMIKGRQKRRLAVEEDIQQLHGASERRSFFAKEKNRKSIVFGPEVSVLLRQS